MISLLHALKCTEKRAQTKDLSGVSGHSPGHHPLQVAAQAHALDSDDGLLGQDGAEDKQEGVGTKLGWRGECSAGGGTYTSGLSGCGL